MKFSQSPLIAGGLTLFCLAHGFGGERVASRSLSNSECADSWRSQLSQERSPNNAQIESIIRTAEQQIRLGTESLKKGKRSVARSHFNSAIDVILQSGFDVRSSPLLQSYYLALIDRVSKLESLTQEQFDRPPFGLDGHAEFSEVEQTVTEDDLASLQDTTRGLGFAIQVNPLIQQYVNFYSLRGRASMEAVLRRAERYERLFRRIFEEEGVPKEFIWIGQALSEWNVYARSGSNTAGIWQLPSEVARNYGLRQTAWVDERFSLEKAPRAAARYLRDMSRRYNGDWLLALASYSIGSGHVDRAINRAGSANFWNIFPYLEQVARMQPVQILATIIISGNKAKYGFPLRSPSPFSYESVDVAPTTDLVALAKLTTISQSALRSLNPELRTQLTPPGESYRLLVPDGKAKVIAASRFASKDRKTREDDAASDRTVGLSVNDGRVVAPSTKPKCGMTIEQVPAIGGYRVGQKMTDVFRELRKTLGANHIDQSEKLSDMERWTTASRMQVTVTRVAPTSSTDSGRIPRIIDVVRLSDIVNILIGEQHWPRDLSQYSEIILVANTGLITSISLEYVDGTRWRDVDDLTLWLSEDLRLTGQWELGSQGCVQRILPCAGLELITSFTQEPISGVYKARITLTDTEASK